MHSSISLVSALMAVAVQATTYTLVDDYDSSNFFSTFDFFDAADPTNGFVEYTNASEANAAGLAGYINNMVYLGADHTTIKPVNGRKSTRVTSKKAYTKGLFIADIAHMPVGCGVWPALWTLGPNWPRGGEIDIIEGVNSQASNAVTLHTAPNCVMNYTGSLPGTKYASGADSVDCGQGTGNAGCSLRTSSTANYGVGFNAGGGGIYAMEWTSEAISVWFWPHGSTQATAIKTSNAPDSSTFDTPQAKFTGCDIDANFKNHQIVLDTTFCGDWAGQAWSTDATCSTLATTCSAYVLDNASAFTDAYWLIDSIRVFQAGSTSSKREAIPPKPLAVPVPVPFIA